MKKIQKVKDFVLSHPDLFILFGLTLIFYLIFFYGIGNYALMDVDESRYVSMAKDMFHTKDYMTLYLNHEYFFEKPPLYFWGECLSFALFGKVTEFTARFPVALYGASCCYLLYFMGRKVVSRSYGVISALILATSLEFIMLAKFAILDIVVSTCIAFSVCLGICTHFCRESHRKYFWWLFYAFSGLAVMAKGIPGFVVPFGTMFFISIFSKRFKEVFTPVYIIPGMILFLLITLPWHILMFKTYDPLFWNEYIIKHHLARFLGSSVINRKQPFYFYFITILWGFFPWIFSCLTVWIKQIVQLVKEKSFKFDYEKMTNPERYLLYNIIAALFILMFFTSSETKLITYILPIYVPMACVGAFVWEKYIFNKENESLINKTIYFLGGIFILTSIAGLLTPLYLPAQLCSDISSIRMFCILATFAVGLASILFVKRKLYVCVFASYVLFMAAVSGFATDNFFEIDYKFGQDDLMMFADYANKKNVALTTFNFGHKYCLLYYGDEDVTFGPGMEPKDLPKELKKKNHMVIIKIKEMKDFKGVKYNIVEQGRRYALIDEK